MSEVEKARQIANVILERVNADPDDDLAVLSRQLLRAHERLAAPAWSQEAMKGELWSFFRHLISQGGDIQMEYSARLDGAARERVQEFLKMMETPKCT